MKHIRARVEESSAWNLIQRQRSSWARLFRREWTPPIPPTRLPRFELIWLPYRLVSFRGQSPKGEEVLIASVQGHCESFALFQMEEVLVDGPPPGPHFPPRIDLARADQVARKELVAMLLRIRGVRGRFSPEEIVDRDIVHYPYWIFYYQKRSYIDFKIIDAVTGAPGASKLRGAVVSAYCEESDRMAKED